MRWMRGSFMRGSRAYTQPMAQFDGDATTTEFAVICPYCGEQVEIYLEPDVMGSLIHDCEVCCRPWQVHVGRDRDYRYIDVVPADA